MEAKTVSVEPSRRSMKLGLSGIREIFEKAQKISDAIRLEFGEPDFDTPENIKAAAIRAINSGKTKYTSSAGIPELRNAISSKLERENKVHYDPTKEIVVTAGATSAINLAFLSTADIGDEILVPDPGWATYSHAIQVAGAVPVPYPLLESEGYTFSRDRAERLVTSKTKVILINTPSNPTGAILSRENLKEIAQFATEHNLFVVSDEVYEKFLYNDSGAKREHVTIASLPDMKERTVTVNAFSKTYAMTGWRMGYAAAPEPISGAMTKINASENSCVSTVGQYAALEALTGPQDSVGRMISAFAKRREVLVKGLNELPGFVCPIPHGAFYAFPNITGTGAQNSYALAMQIVEKGHVAVVPGSSFGAQGEAHLRLAYANSLENIQAALERIRKIL